MKLLLADNHTLFRDVLMHYIENVEPDIKIHPANDMQEVMDYMSGDLPAPDLAVLDQKIPGMNGLEGLEKFREDYPEIPVAIMSGHVQSRYVKKVLASGAMGYFPRTLSGKSFLKAIKLVVRGEIFIPPECDNEFLISALADNDKAGNGLSYGYMGKSVCGLKGGNNLTAREQQVLSCLLKGSSNKEIADKLGLQVVTIKLHVRGIFRKLGAKNRTQAALKAKELGFEPVP
jgi:DNA-binding NarL/FixJ family response regulator